MPGEMKASPRYGLMGFFADALKEAQSGMNYVDLPYVGGLGDLVLGGAPQLADDISYQGLSGLMRGGNVATGGIGTYGLKPEAVDLAGVMTGLGGLARPAASAAARGVVKNMGARNMSGLPMARGQVGSVGSHNSAPKGAYVKSSIESDYYLDAFGEEIESDPYFLINHVFVPKEMRNKGVARKLLADEINLLKAKDPNMNIRLNAEPLDQSTDQERLVNFYESMGFKVDKKQGGDGVFMTLVK